MNISINEIFGEGNLSSEEAMYYKGLFYEIDKNFKEKNFSFINLKNKKGYLDVLIKYLEINGFGYLLKKVSTLQVEKEEDRVILANLLIDSNFIDKPLLKVKGTFPKDKCVSYEVEYGIDKTFNIKYGIENLPFKINSIDYENTKYINCNIVNNSKEIEVNIKIDADVNETLNETIVVYTDYGVEYFNFNVKAMDNNSQILFKDFSEYLELCRIDEKEAKRIFQSYEFKQWLNKKKYISQVINYEKSLELSLLKRDRFRIFCALNFIFLDEEINEKESTVVEGKQENSYDKGTKGKEQTLKEDKIEYINEKINKPSDRVEINPTKDKDAKKEQPAQKKESKVNIFDEVYNKSKKLLKKVFSKKN